jgi:hypothetical protein
VGEAEAARNDLNGIMEWNLTLDRQLRQAVKDQDEESNQQVIFASV